jgi:AraC family transcriptional regulator of adaptative response/methylated-DNA-[protein]-cysteine methyltransferase
MATVFESANILPVTPFERDDDRWRALVDRASRADGAFVYAVKTTGVFCKPSCASRRPLRANVEFFARPEDAERSGYRACLRCKPTESAPLARILVRACRALEADGIVRSEDIARAVGLSAFHFQRVFKKHMGVTPQEYRRRVIAERAKDELSSAQSVTEAALAAGYGSSSRFYDGAARELGMAARDVRGAVVDVRFTVRACSLGRVLVAWTERGACDVAFGDSDDEVVGELRARFPSAELARARVPAWVDAIVAIVDAREDRRDIPLDIRGTAFQERVWRELRKIPRGETRTYAEVAREIGGSARAVGGACASNRLAVVVPCHRVVRADGEITGYRWGTERKRALLRRERTS